MAVVTGYIKVNLSYLIQVLKGGSLTNYQITSGSLPADAVYDSWQMDTTTNPPTIILGYKSATPPSGFLLPVAANGPAHKPWS